MIKQLIKTSFIALTLFGANSAQAIVNTNDLKRYCGQEEVQRQTVLYLDQGIIAKTDTVWYRDIVNKLKFLPGEKLQVITVKDGGSEVELAWEACYPGYTPTKYAEMKEKGGFSRLFLGDVDDQIKKDLTFFNNNFKRALAHPLAATRHEQKPRFSAATFPNKKLVEALYYDAKRLDLENGISRVIIFSDMIEKSQLVAHQELDPQAAATIAAERFPMFLNYSSFYIYGINYTHGESELNTQMERFWRTYLLQSGANIEHYGSQLVLPRTNELFAVNSYSGFLTQSDGRKVAAKLRLGYYPDGELVHSVLTVGDEFMPITGSQQVSGKNVELRANITNSTFSGFKKKDVLTLSGNQNKLSGQVGAPDDRTVDEKGAAYLFDVNFDKDNNLSL